ncbi:MAG: peptidyl-prolyl cis-trans isomerase [Deltaproteobacteria bacterium]|nr:peptidyl-prolyl cis-trans isomerase [Deltaproteobacteria bacterium]MDQ3296327.1 peptidyl-prolyl cis-trans isomerase [Myxococcota bacterium]
MRAVGVVCVLVAASCGSQADPVARSRPATSTIAPAAGPDDVIVAQINGRPVWGSCVAAQARAADDAAARRAALDECVAFELLAQAAEAKGFASDPDVGEATRAALVDQLVETAFENRYRTPADLADVIGKILDRHTDRLSTPEGRASAYARVPVALDAPADRDAAARALAERIAATLADETGLFPIHLDETARRLAEGTGLTVEFAPTDVQPKETLVDSYGDALFAIREVGRIAPEPVRTRWGWDVILLSQRIPARKRTREELAAEAFPDVRRSYFQVWVNGIVRSLGVKIEIDPEQLAQIDEVMP